VSSDGDPKNAPHSALSYQHVPDAFHPLRWLPPPRS